MKEMDLQEGIPIFLANFVRMKKSLRHLPAEKRRDLRQLVEIIRDEINDVVMIILYGSYARGNYTDYDQRIEYGVPTYFMSDYDIMIVTEKRMGVKEHTIYANILRRFFVNKAWEIHTHPQFINESITDLNKALDKSRYFYTDIKKDGIMLYDSGQYKLARRRRLNYAEIAEMAQEYYDSTFHRANQFLKGVKFYLADGDNKMASFHLHQAAENFLRTIPLVYILYGYKEHDLAFLMNECKKHTLEIYKAFPQDTDEERRLFKLLQDAYVQARYNKDFVVTQADIGALIPRIELLRDITETVCRERIAGYCAMK